MIFNNGRGRPDSIQYSSIEILSTPLNEDGSYTLNQGLYFFPDTVDRTYTTENKEDFYSVGTGSAQRLPNGNTFICEGFSGRFFEFTEEGTIVWEYVILLFKMIVFSSREILSLILFPID